MLVPKSLSITVPHFARHSGNRAAGAAGSQFERGRELGNLIAPSGRGESRPMSRVVAPWCALPRNLAVFMRSLSSGLSRNFPGICRRQSRSKEEQIVEKSFCNFVLNVVQCEDLLSAVGQRTLELQWGKPGRARLGWVRWRRHIWSGGGSAMSTIPRRYRKPGARCVRTRHQSAHLSRMSRR